MKKIFDEIKQRRKDQDKKWGPTSHPCLDEVLLNREGSCTSKRMTEEYNMPSENIAKTQCDNAFRKGQGTWAHIAVEELTEVISEFDIEKRRNELIDLAAVCIAWIEDIDKKTILEKMQKESDETTIKGNLIHEEMKKNLLRSEFHLKWPTKPYPGRISGLYEWIWDDEKQLDGNWIERNNPCKYGEI